MNQMMTITAWESVELSRCANAMYRVGQNLNGHLLSAVSAKTEVPICQYDRALEVYRRWLVFGEVA